MIRPQLNVFNFSFTNASDDTLDIYIDGYIVDAPTQEILQEYWGDETSVSFKSFRNQITSSKAKTINVYINSGGGHVGDAMAMHDYLVDIQSKGITVNTKGIGIVASAATYLLMSSKNSSLSENSWFMIHNVQGAIWGDVNQIENYAKTMRKFNNQIRDFYSNSSGQEPEQISALMNKESWLTAQEAKDKGFVKNITGKENFKNAIKEDQWMFANTSVLNAYNSFTHTNFQMETNKITEAIQNGFNALLEKLGISNKKDDATVQTAFSEFTNSITEALKNAAPTQESIQTLVNNAVAESLKNLGENESIKNAITEGLKNTITKEDLTTAINNLTTALSDKIGNKSKADDKEGKDDKDRKPKNKFSTAKLWSEN